MMALVAYTSALTVVGTTAVAVGLAGPLVILIAVLFVLPYLNAGHRRRLLRRL